MSDLRLAVVGCGVISTRYLQNAPMFKGVKITTCADLRPEMADKQAAAFGIKAKSLDAVFRDSKIDAIINLTIPNAHFEVSRRAIKAGKHVFSEKPLTVQPRDAKKLVEMADREGLALAVAPDTFLGPGHRMARASVDSGEIGKVMVGTAFFMSRGMEHWHPDPTFFFQPGGGPVLDMGPYYISALVNMLGPVSRVTAMDGMGLSERTITADGPKKGSVIKVGVPTTSLAALEFASGAMVSLSLSWDVFQHGHRPLELYGTLGSLRAPDPNFFGGEVEVAHAREPWQVRSSLHELCGKPNHPDDKPIFANYRMLGVADMADAIGKGLKPRASGELGLHVLDVMDAILRAGKTRKSVSVSGGIRPRPFSEAEVSSLLASPDSTRG